MDPTKLRMRYLLSFLLAALVTAAALRHLLHVQAGLTREEIRRLVFIIAGIGIVLAIAFFRLRRRR
jgi:hypothetical protein